VILKNKGHMIDGVRVSENTAMKYWVLEHSLFSTENISLNYGKI
jgi:hypothetical protein